MPEKEPKTILIGIPTYGGKKYCQDEFFEALSKLKIPQGYEADILIVENTYNPMDTAYYQELLELLNKMKINNASLAHVSVAKVFTEQQRVAFFYNCIRGYMMNLGFDYILTVESDVMVKPDDLCLLMETMEKHPEVGIVGSVTEYHEVKPNEEDKKQLLDAGVFIPPEACLNPKPHTLIHKFLSIDEQNIGTMAFELAFIVTGEQGNKTGWMQIVLPQMNKHGLYIEHETYSHEEMVKLAEIGEPFECAATALGLTLIRAEVMESIPFRGRPDYAMFSDIYLPIDARKAGWKVWCDPRVWPVHKARGWD